MFNLRLDPIQALVQFQSVSLFLSFNLSDYMLALRLRKAAWVQLKSWHRSSSAQKLMMVPKGVALKEHGPYTFKPPSEMSPGFGIISQRPDGKGAMVNGLEAGGQAEKQGVGDGWAIKTINGTNITDMPFIKDFNEIGAGTMGGVTAIAEILGGLSADFTMEFVELPKREFSEKVDIWSLGCVAFTMLAGVTPFKEEANIVNGELDETAMAHCSDDAKDFVKKVLILDPSQRPTLDEVMAHPFMKL